MNSSIYVKLCSLQAPERLQEWKNVTCIFKSLEILHDSVFFFFVLFIFLGGQF